MNSTLPIRPALIISLFWLLASQLAFGQTFGSIAGETRDVTGAVAAVSRSPPRTKEPAQPARSSPTKRRLFVSVAPARHLHSAGRKAGFKTVVRNQIELQVQQAARIDFELQVGEVVESVEVRATPRCWQPRTRPSAR